MTQHDLPRISRRFLRWALHADDRRFALDDLEEDFERRMDRLGRRSARRWYRAQVRRSLLPALASRLARLPRSLIADLVDDVRFALRTTAKAPMVAVVTVLSLAVGIAAATSVFTTANAFLMRPPSSAISNPDGLIAIYTVDADGSHNVTSYPDYEDILEQVDAFADVAAVRMGVLQLDEQDGHRRIAAEIVSANYFDLLGIAMPIGRSFSPAESRVGSAERVVVISHGLWQSRFGGDPRVVGEVLELDGFPFTVIGVAPADLTSRLLALKINAWVPLGIPGGTYHSDERELADRGDREHSLVARLADGATVEQAQAQLDLLSARLHAEYREAWEDERTRPLALRLVAGPSAHMPPDWTVAFAAAGGLVMGAAGFVLLIACFNVASLFLAQASKRSHEMAVRLALGASRRRLVVMLLTESLILALFAGGIGIFLSTRVTSMIDSIALPIGGLTMEFDFSLDYRVLGFTLLLSAFTSVIFGLAPALEASKPSLLPSLNGERADTRRRHRRFGARNLLVIGQVAAALIFVVGTGITLTSFWALAASDWGVNPDRIALMSKNLPEEVAPDAFVPYYHDLMARLANHPEVANVQLSRATEGGIFAVDNTVEIRVDGYERAADESLTVPFNAVTPGYMEMLQIRLVRGRAISEDDVAGATRAAIVTEAFARRFFGGSSGLGEQFSIVARVEMGDPMRQEPIPYEVVGVTADAPYQGFESSGRTYIWTSLYQHPARRVNLFLQGHSDADAMVQVLAGEVDPEDRELALVTPQTYEELIQYQFAFLTWMAKALAAAGLFGLALATIGIYSTVSFAVNRRGRELAIRLAVGALPQQVMRTVLREGMILSAWGLVGGLIVVIPISMGVRSGIAGVSAVDPLSTGVGALLLLLVALLASAIPASRVARIDPVSTLRKE